MFIKLEVTMINKQAQEIEQLGTLPANILQFIYDHKLFKLFVPTELGGADLELPEALRVFQTAAAIDGSFGWLVTIGSGGNMFVPYIHKETCDRLFADPKAVIAGSGYPTGTAVKTNEGYHVTGEWKYCSGATYASFFTANCFVEDAGVLTDTVISCIFMPKDVEIVEDWDAFGLKGTGSHTIKVNDVMVSEDNTFSLLERKNAYGSHVYTYPFMQFSEASFVAVCLGIGEGFFQEAKECLQRKKAVWSDNQQERAESLTKLIEKNVAVFQQAEHEFYEALTTSWENHIRGEQLTDGELERLTGICKKSVAITIACANELIRHFGMEAIKESSALNRIWRNLYTAGQHAFITPEP